MTDSSSRDFEAWVSIGNFTGWVWENLVTRAGVVILCTCALVVSALEAFLMGNPWLGMVYLPFAIIGLGFLVILAGLIGFTGDIFARWAIHKVVAGPSPKNNWHQCLYFILSSVGFILAAAFIIPYFIGGDWGH